MAVSYLKRPDEPAWAPARRARVSARRPRRWAPLMAGAALLALLAVAGAALILGSVGARLTPDPEALARVELPFGGARIVSASAVTGPHSQPVAVSVRGERIWPQGQVAAGERLTIDVTVRRPGWIAWAAGATQHLELALSTPAARLRTQYVTLAPGAPLRMAFDSPVRVIAYGDGPGHLERHVLPEAETAVTLVRNSSAGNIWVAAMPRSWETAAPTFVSWFPAGAGASAVASPAPGTAISPLTPITLTFSKPVARALGGSLPSVWPITSGTWQHLGENSIVFRPAGLGYGLGARVKIALPGGVRLLGAGAGAATWTVPPGSTLRLQQLLALLGYLPLDFHYSGTGVPLTPQAQESAAVAPAPGSFQWRYPNVPGALRGFWQAGAAGVMTRGAVMAFEDQHGLVTDGVAGPQVWRALIGAVLAGQRSSFGYTFVSVDKGSQRLTLWHNGQTVLSTPVNTGISAAPTAAGTYPVYEHIRSGTMSGTNPNGSHYNDRGVPWISYFNGGDALHGFTRAQYGFPQSLGCVEMPLGTAGQVWPYTPIGTLVRVA